MLERATTSFRRRHSLDDAGAVQRWLGEQALAEADLARLLTDEANAQRVREIFEADLDRGLADVLRLSGGYAALAERADRKHAQLHDRGLDNPTLEQCGVTEDELWRWYFEERLGRPEPGDLMAAAVAAGFRDTDAMRRTLLREYCYAGPGDGAG
jgi:hypothetical protein